MKSDREHEVATHIVLIFFRSAIDLPSYKILSLSSVKLNLLSFALERGLVVIFWFLMRLKTSELGEVIDR